MAFILALDQGTTSSRAILFDRAGATAALAQREFRQIYPRAGWVEHDPAEIAFSQLEVAREALAQAGAGPRDVVALGLTNQRETTLLWDRRSGAPVMNAIVWQDRRTAEACDALRAGGHEKRVREKTGLVIDPYFSGTKLAWMLDNVPGARTRAEAGELAFGTVDSWLVWQLTAGRRHVTDASNASRTLLFNIHAGAWDDELLALLRVPRALLPEVCGSGEVLGEASLPGLEGIPIAGIAGDQQAALFGQMCVAPGQAKNTYGTGCFLLQNLGQHATLSKQGLVTTVAWRREGVTEYALEGSVFIGGAVVQWLRDGLGLIRSSADVEALAASVPDAGGVFLVPAFAGLGAPHWDAWARGALLGLTRGTGPGHIARAALEGIAFQVADLVGAMQADAGIDLPELRVDGGASRNDLLLQIQADLLGVPVVRPVVTETTALGAAYLAGLATGFWKDVEETAAQWRVEKRFEPRISRAEAGARRARWRDALDRTRAWERP
jgi:glycerol kinase